MKMNFGLHLGIIVVLSVLISCRMHIKPLDPIIYTERDTLIQGKHTGNLQVKYFFVENFTRNQKNLDSLKKFALHQVPENIAQYNHFIICFYKETRVLNEDYRYSDEDQLAWHDDDMLFEFRWFNGKLLSFSEYNNGRRINRDAVQDVQLTIPADQ